MKRTIITLMATLAVIVATVCMAFTMTACEEKKADSYKITVTYEDGTPVNGLKDGTAGVKGNGEADTKVQVQICAADYQTGVTGPNDFCTKMLDLGANGKLEVKSSTLPDNKLKDNQKWHVKLQGLKSGYSCEEIFLDKGYGKYTMVVTVAD